MAAAGSSGPNPNPWAAYDSYKDCSQGICSIYCPQWCYMIFPPPPPFSLEDESPSDFSPLIIAAIGILASAFILVSYYTIISKYCRRRRNNDDATSGSIEFHGNHAVTSNNNINAGGLDEALIKSITVVKYKKGDGLVEGTDCSVCLSEFVEDESLRILPKCNHAFHLPCIDTWFNSHCNCPLCRANIQQTVSVNQCQHTNQTHVLVIHHVNVGDQEASAAAAVNHHHDHHDHHDLDVENLGERHNTISHDHHQDHQIVPITRSVSMNSSVMCQGPVLVADILRGNEEEEGDDDDDDDHRMDKSRSQRVLNLVMNTPLPFKRSLSTGRFLFTRYASKSGNHSIIPT
ncbi:hypothetical protein Ddye_026289 [Dipteronia dyeriana]|uniref:RING-type E3 ubiquitin transferase n=1 Tax=Dipteronia dyeriana TaxID=168575 RepID=A0AAD9TMV3_9ROSI|nr:hypothetical protein Ddye_026289 [Dipteronia dyeriana]